MPDPTPALWVGGTALLAAILRYWEKKRTSSGSIRTSEADEIWDAQEKERAYLRQELDSVRAELLRCRANNHALRNEVMKMQMIMEVPGVPKETIERIISNSQVHIGLLLEEAIRLERSSDSSRKTDSPPDQGE